MTTIYLLGVRISIGHGFGYLSPLPSYIGFLYRGNYGIHDNIFGSIAGEVEAYLGLTIILKLYSRSLCQHFGIVAGEVEAILGSTYLTFPYGISFIAELLVWFT